MSVEYEIQERLVNWVQTNFPEIHYRVDLAGEYFPHIGQAGRIAKLQKSRGWPDLFIAKSNIYYNGLFLEIKSDISAIFNNNGDFASLHITEQNTVLHALRKQGFCAEFVAGLQHGLELLNWYFDLPYKKGEFSPMSVLLQCL
jgi:hypothetical protein